MKSILSKLKSRLKFRRPNNLRVVVLSIGTAAIFWLFQALGKTNATTLDYPVTWQFDTEEYIVVDKLPEKISINVEGIGWNLLRAYLGFKVTPVIIVLNNPASRKKIAGVSLTNRVNDQLDEIKLNYILDDTLNVHIDKRGTRSFGVYIDSINISLAENYRIVSPISYDVDLLELEGPISLIKSIPSDSFMLYVKEQGLNSNFDEQIEFEIDRPELFLFRPKSAHVSFTIAEFIEAERQIIVEQIDFPEDGNVILTDTLCTVQFLVRKDLEQAVVADSFTVVANYKLINNLDSTLLLSIQKSASEALNVRIELPQVGIRYNE